MRLINLIGRKVVADFSNYTLRQWTRKETWTDFTWSILIPVGPLIGLQNIGFVRIGMYLKFWKNLLEILPSLRALGRRQDW
jgi:hypothetical protein